MIDTMNAIGEQNATVARNETRISEKYMDMVTKDEKIIEKNINNIKELYEKYSSGFNMERWNETVTRFQRKLFEEL